jgi:hypothetical protein
MIVTFSGESRQNLARNAYEERHADQASLRADYLVPGGEFSR